MSHNGNNTTFLGGVNVRFFNNPELQELLDLTDELSKKLNLIVNFTEQSRRIFHTGLKFEDILKIVSSLVITSVENEKLNFKAWKF